MSSVAQKLCKDLVGPALKSTGTQENFPSTSQTTYYTKPSITTTRNGSTTRTVVVEKKKVINKISNDCAKPEVVRLHSKETAYKKNFKDTAINTQKAGTLRSLNKGPLIARRELTCSCRPTYRKVPQRSTKLVQTYFNEKFNMHYDKACSNCVETVSCGIQFIDPSAIGSKLNVKPVCKGSNLNTMGTKSLAYSTPGKRWAVSRYAARGPDF